MSAAEQITIHGSVAEVWHEPGSKFYRRSKPRRTKTSEGQLIAITDEVPIRRKPPKGGWLKAPLSKQEQRQMGQMYVEHQGLIRLLGAKLTRQFPMVDNLDVFSCIDVAFLKSCRAFDPTKGKFSTIFTKFATGEIRHFIRDHNFILAAPSKVRELSVPVRRLRAIGHSLEEIAQILGVSKRDCKDAIIATAGVDHEIQGFELHECAKPGPMQWLIEKEEAAS